MFRIKNVNKILQRSNSTLVFFEHKNNQLNPSSLNAFSAATKLGNPITGLLTGNVSKELVEKVSSLQNLKKLLVANDKKLENNLPENLASLILQSTKEESATHLVGAATAVVKNTLPRVAALLDVSQVSDVIEVISNDTFKRPIYAGNAIATVKSSEAVKVLTVRSTAFPPATFGDSKAEVKEIQLKEQSLNGKSEFVKEDLQKSDRPSLTAARTIVSGGRGMKNGENFKMLYELADCFESGTVGASRAAADAGWVSNDLQVGQTGKIVAPELYVAVGVSGAIQHLAGMKDSKTIVSINKDPEAPIFLVSDYGLVDDLFKAVPEITKALKN
ncbi:hypothetical protein HK099_000407 [Clydaea vesicula]|uniref:Probable electron transfer flavoprotein subunit alpha n=1 Tax=Clydaea vesicula TaxID=447962 RepID=A0AAD5TY12_9FUNG|nr:hypothetical protein HK099_000407 [Clydaea vesicula]KAJ3396131.1 hypothetical protein HDU92_004000 [Lobulomyces angularis]